MRAASTPLRLAVVCDFAEEGWPSMDLAGEMLVEELRRRPELGVTPTLVRPPLRRRFSRRRENRGSRFNLDRLINRFFDYPRYLGRRRAEFDLFHFVDHSYSHLLRELPAGRAVVTCHDLDTFRCLLDPGSEPRSLLFRLMTRRILRGFQTAARVVCDSAAVRDELLASRLLPPQCLEVVPLGIHAAFGAEPDAVADRSAEVLLGPRRQEVPEILHVGSTIARKRIEFLLAVFAELRRQFPAAVLVRVGAPLRPEQRSRAVTLGLTPAIRELPFLRPAVLAAVYRRASLLLLPSAREGFGLPVLEALACGAPAVASDLPVLRATGGEAPRYCPPEDFGGWVSAAGDVMRLAAKDPGAAERRLKGIVWAARFTGSAYADRMAQIYRETET